MRSQVNSGGNTGARAAGRAGQQPARRRRGRHILILDQNLPVPFDRRVWQEARALTAAGYQVHVICPRSADFPARRETIGGIRIYRYPPGPEAGRWPAT